jgi:hypothetical protein
VLGREHERVSPWCVDLLLEMTSSDFEMVMRRSLAVRLW